jgi:hypothetical protein
MPCLNRKNPAYSDKGWETDLATKIINKNGTYVLLPQDQAHNVKIRDRVKLDCCLDTNMSGYDINKDQMCSPEWCPKNESSACDDVTKEFCSDDNIFGNITNGYKDSLGMDIGSGCYNFCLQSVKPNGVPRKDDSTHWCYGRVKDYCEKGFKMMGDDKICKDVYDSSERTKTSTAVPDWADDRSQLICTSLKDREEEDIQGGKKKIDKYGYCGCINSDEYAASCVDNHCRIDSGAYVPKKAHGDCPKCVSVIQACAQGRVNISDITITQNCPLSSQTFWGCDDSGKCSLMDHGAYDDQKTCEEACAKSHKPGPKPPSPGPNPPDNPSDNPPSPPPSSIKPYVIGLSIFAVFMLIILIIAMRRRK